MATHEDALIIIQLQQWGAQLGMRAAVGQVFDELFDPETADTKDEAIHAILEFGETIGTLVKHDVLDRALVVDLWWVDGLWTRVGPAAIKMRKDAGEPRLFENFEALASS